MHAYFAFLLMICAEPDINDLRRFPPQWVAYEQWRNWQDHSCWLNTLMWKDGVSPYEVELAKAAKDAIEPARKAWSNLDSVLRFYINHEITLENWEWRKIKALEYLKELKNSLGPVHYALGVMPARFPDGYIHFFDGDQWKYREGREPRD